jgi:hypothetical protein
MCDAKVFEELLPDVLAGRIEPGRVFDSVTDLDGVPVAFYAGWPSAVTAVGVAREVFAKK